MTHFRKYWIWYTIAIVVVIAAILAYANWETVKGWFQSEEEAGRTQAPGSTSKQACVRIGNGCSYNGLYVPCIECSKRGIVIN